MTAVRLTHPVSLSVPGAEVDWIVVPNDFQNASDRKIAKWAASAARSVLPKRLFGQDPQQFPIQASLAAAAAMTSPNERAYVLRATLPDQFLPVRLRWLRLGNSPRQTLLELATPDLKQTTLGTPSEWLSPLGTSGLRTSITRDHSEHGYIAAFPLDDLGVQVKVDVDGRALLAMQGAVADLIQRIRRVS